MIRVAQVNSFYTLVQTEAGEVVGENKFWVVYLDGLGLEMYPFWRP